MNKVVQSVKAWLARRREDRQKRRREKKLARLEFIEARYEFIDSKGLKMTMYELFYEMGPLVREIRQLRSDLGLPLPSKYKPLFPEE